MLWCYTSLSLLLLLLWQPSARPQSWWEPLKEPLCQKQGYNKTILPNFFGHRSQKKAMAEIAQLIPLVTIDCSKDMTFFLCSVFFPIFTTFEKFIPPCRSLCDNARSGCQGIMKKFGFAWPSQLNCNHFPKFESAQMCVSQNKSNSQVLATTAPPSRKISSRVVMDALSPREWQKICWSKRGANKHCCRQGNKAAKMGIQQCSLVQSSRKGARLSRKQTRFLKKSNKTCLANEMSKICYESCCKYKNNRQLKRKKNKPKKGGKTKRRQP